MGDAHAADRVGEEVGVRSRDLIVQHIDHHAPLPILVPVGQARGEVADQGQGRQDVDLVMKAQVRLTEGLQPIIDEQGGVVDQRPQRPEGGGPGGP